MKRRDAVGIKFLRPALPTQVIRDVSGIELTVKKQKLNPPEFSPPPRKTT
jgi:hypothetical protein